MLYQAGLGLSLKISAIAVDSSANLLASSFPVVKRAFPPLPDFDSVGADFDILSLLSRAGFEENLPPLFGLCRLFPPEREDEDDCFGLVIVRLVILWARELTIAWESPYTILELWG